VTTAADPVATAITAPTDQRRLKIVESALSVFSRKGFYDSRVEDVCAAAGISRATFYRYFDGKDEVFDALIEMMSAEVLATAEHLGAVTPDDQGRATISNWIRDLVEITERWGTVVDEVVRPQENASDARSRAVLLTARFADILAARFTDGGVEGIDPQMAALAIIAMTERMAHQIRTWNIEIDRQQVIDSLATLSMKMLHPWMPLPTVS
jgi:AcrR family transcriptional regulator